jgi:phosphohistidine phosphatase
MTDKPDWLYTQSAVIPYRINSGMVEILIVTSIKRKRWVLPKGVVEPGMTPQASAIKEAWEEAGVHGYITGETEIGSYRYEKWGGVCTVRVYPFVVTEIFDSWPEANARERRWVDETEACTHIQEESVQELIRLFFRSLERMT